MSTNEWDDRIVLTEEEQRIKELNFAEDLAWMDEEILKKIEKELLDEQAGSQKKSS